MTNRYDRFRATPLDKTMPDGSPAYRVERRSDADRLWHPDSGSMSQVNAERLAARANDPLRLRT
jgi:hypothetical protein